MRQFLVLRGAIPPAEHKVLAEKIHAEFRAGVYDDYGGNFEKGIHYPNPKVRYDHGSLLLEKDPHIAQLSLDQPSVVSAVEELLDGPAVISQWRTYINPPGFQTEAVTGKPYVDGRGAHFDCKPWRPAGSFLDWMFAVIPLCDYLPDVGPMRAGPYDENGLATPMKELPSDGRVHKMAVNRMPPLDSIKLQDPSLRRGDVILMSGYCWHEACPNFTKDVDRFGICECTTCAHQILLSSNQPVLLRQTKSTTPRRHRRPSAHGSIRPTRGRPCVIRTSCRTTAAMAASPPRRTPTDRSLISQSASRGLKAEWTRRCR